METPNNEVSPENLWLPFGYVVFFVEGLVLWAASLSLTGRHEPWDSLFYFSVIAPTGLALGVFAKPVRMSLLVSSFMGIWMGQLIAILAVPHLHRQRLGFPIVLISSAFFGGVLLCASMGLGILVRSLLSGKRRESR